MLRKVTFEYNNDNVSAVYGKEGENSDFCKATPSGQLEMSIDKDAPACSCFVVGKSYYLTFDEAE